MDRDTYLAELAAADANGASQRELARRFGKSRSTIRRDLDRLKPRAAPVPATRGDAPRVPAPIVFRQVPLADKTQLQGGRATTMGSGPGAPSAPKGNLLPQPDQWRISDVEPSHLLNLNPAELLSRLVRISPEIGRARYDFLRLANPGWTWQAVIPGTEEPHEQGQVALDMFVDTLRLRHGSPNVVFNRLLDGVFMRGALFCELVLDRTARIPLDIATPDPYTAEFRFIDDPEVGTRWELVQQQVVGGQRRIVPIERPTVKYVPLDPLPDSPFGTPMVTPALFPALFILTMLQDARRVVAQQGWPRLDIEVLVSELIQTMPDADRQDAAKVRRWVEDTIAEVAAAYGELDPDKAWVHTDSVHIGNPIGAIGNLQGVAPLVDILERMNVRGTKTMPMMMGLPEGVSEANANRQWEMLTKGTEAVQLLVEHPLSDLGTIVLEAQGIPAVSLFVFDEMRSSEELRDAQALNQKLVNAQLAEQLGYMSHDEASVYAVGHEPAEEQDAAADAAEQLPTTVDAAEPIEGEEPVDGDQPETPADEDAADADARSALHRVGLPWHVVTIQADIRRAVEALEVLARAIEPGVKVEPQGDAAQLPPPPSSVPVDATDMRRAASDWNAQMPARYHGLLQADVIEEDPADD